MQNTKKIIILFFLLSFSFGMSAQGFSSFKPEGAIVPTLIKFNTQGNSYIETIVDASVNIADLPVSYKLLSGCKFDSVATLNTDFKKAQSITIAKKGGDTKVWDVIVHQLVPAKLPYTLSFGKENKCDLSFANPKSWAGYGIDYTKPIVARFGNSGVGFFTAFEPGAKDVSFELTVVGKQPFDGEFDVESSVDGKSWKNIKTYKNGEFSDATQLTLSLPGDSRFVRWVYTVRNKQNVNLNNIRIQ